MMMIGLLVMTAVVVIGLIMRRRATLPPPAMAGAGRMPDGSVDYLPGGVSSPSRYVVSVLYRGMILEKKGGAAESINEIWHLDKPRHGQSGWLVSGIQQMH